MFCQLLDKLDQFGSYWTKTFWTGWFRLTVTVLNLTGEVGPVDVYKIFRFDKYYMYLHMFERGKNNVMYTKLTVPKRDSVTRLKTATEFPVMDMENLWLPAHI